MRATERYSYGWSDPRAIWGSHEARTLRLGEHLFRTDAEARGYDMELFKRAVRDGALYLPWWSHR